MSELTAQQTFSSRLNVLAVENEERISKRTQKPYRHFVARCVVLDDKGGVLTVGSLRSDQCVQELREALKAGDSGIYRAGYGLRVPDFGDQKGDVVCLVTSLVPERAPAQGKAVA